MFDVKQTEGKPLPEISSIAGDPGEHLVRLKEFTTSQGIDLQYVADLGGAEASKPANPLKNAIDPPKTLSRPRVRGSKN